MNQGPDLLVGGLPRLVRLQDDAEDLAQFLAGPWDAVVGPAAGCMLRQLLQQSFHGQRKADDVAPRAVAVPCHVGLLVEDGAARLLAVLGLHRHHHQAGQTRGRARQLDDGNLEPVDHFETISCPHVVGVAQRRKPGLGKMVHALGADRKPTFVAQRLAF